MRRPHRHPGRLVRLLLVLAVGLTTGCIDGSGDSDGSGHPRDVAAATPTAASDVVHGLQGLLARRAAAVRRGDVGAFDAGLAHRSAAFVHRQHAWFDAVDQLPLSRFGYALDPGTLDRRGGGYTAVVAQTMQLDGYDARPVTTPDLFRFVAARRPGRYLLASTRDPAWERQHHVQPQPWDLQPVEVRTGDGVLGVFDRGSVADADAVVASAEAALGSVSAVVPYRWSRSVVVYDLSDPTFLASLEDVPGDDPASLDAVAFPVPSAPDGPTAATRVVLNPSLVGHNDAERDRLIRHEVTHVAVGVHDDHAPVWLSEGIAELVSVQPLAPERRRIDAVAVTAARAGIADLPDDATFNDAGSGVHYAVSWWACEYLTETYGPTEVWALLDAMDRPGTDPDRALRDQVGLTSRQLARRAGRLILATYAPENWPRRDRS